jgi:putative phosphoribosyl transferase
MAGAERARRFHDRFEAGRRLAGELLAYVGRDDVLVVALPRGGVPVGFEVSHALRAPLEVMQVRKLGVPGHEELAMGAIASGGVRIVSENVVEALGIPERVIATVAATEAEELERRERVYREGRLFPEMGGRTVILVDDGLATGSTMRAAAAALRSLGVARLVAAVPVAPKESCEAMREVVDELVCVSVPERFQAVGEWYEDFSQISDQEVSELLGRGGHDARRRVT